MAIEPEVFPPSSKAGENAIKLVPGWAIFASLMLVVMVVVGLLKFLLPLILFGFVTSLIWRQATK